MAKIPPPQAHNATCLETPYVSRGRVGNSTLAAGIESILLSIRLGVRAEIKVFELCARTYARINVSSTCDYYRSEK